MPIFETYLKISLLLNKLWSNFSVTLLQVFNLKNSLVLLFWSWVKLNNSLAFYTSLLIYHCNTYVVDNESYCSFTYPERWNLIISQYLFYLQVIISFLVMEYSNILFIFVVISRLFKCLMMESTLLPCKI